MEMWDYANIKEVSIDRPAKDVWPYLFGTKKDIWTKSVSRTVSGAPGEVGEIYVYEHKRHGADVISFFETIMVTPERNLVMKITHGKKKDTARTLVGYDFVTLRELNGTTKVTLLQALAIPLEKSDRSPEEKSLEQDAFLEEIIKYLKVVVESGLE